VKARYIAIAMLVIGIFAQSAVASPTETFVHPMETWERHASDTYDTFYEDTVKFPHPCRTNGYVGDRCYRGGSSASPGGVPRHCGFGPEYQDGHHHLYGNQEDNQCSAQWHTERRMHAGFDYDDPRHGHQQENCGSSCPDHGNEDNVLAAASGWIVAKVENDGINDDNFGNTVRIKHKCAENCDYDTGVDQQTVDIFFTQYSHCADGTMTTKEWVARGDTVCKVGGTGNRQPDFWLVHLHFEVKDQDQLTGSCQNDAGETATAPGYVDVDRFTMEECGYYDPAQFIERVRVYSDSDDVPFCSQCGGAGEEPEDNSPIPKYCFGPGPLSLECSLIFTRILLLGQ